MPNVSMKKSKRQMKLKNMNKKGLQNSGEVGQPMQKRMKEHDRDIRLAPTQNSVVSEHANGTGDKLLWNEI